MVHRTPAIAFTACAAALSTVPLLAWIGLGIHRHAAPVAITAGALVLLYGPPIGMAVVARARERLIAFAGGLAAWSVAMFLVLPLYFPGERRQAVATGLGVLGLGVDQLPQRIAANLPDEPAVATPEVAEAQPITVPAVPPPGTELREDQIALPYEGEGRRMSVPVIFGNAGREVEVDMLFDTGATYTTLPRDLLAKLGVVPGDDDPVITLHTANGQRDTQVVLLDKVWLGDLTIPGVAVAVCDDCAGTDVSGLLGLNVAGGFNVAIDADRREVVFTRRATFDRKLDVKPFADLAATFTRFPGGRVEVEVRIANKSRRSILQAITSVRCADHLWTVDLPEIAAATTGTTTRKLPMHDACEQYEIALHEASW
ncbi:MAG: retropepsin-like aspartic protease [Myxococcota bacterium]